MTNREFIQKYIRGVHRFGANAHLGYCEEKLYNYSTVICIIDRENKRAQVNSHKYSVTTSKIQTMLRTELSYAGYDVSEFDGEPCSYWNCGYMGAGRVTMDDMRGRRFER